MKWVMLIVIVTVIDTLKQPAISASQIICPWNNATAGTHQLKSCEFCFNQWLIPAVSDFQ